MLRVSYREKNRISSIVPHGTFNFQSSLKTLVNSPLTQGNAVQSAVCSFTSYARFWEDPGPFPQLIHITIAQITLEEPVFSAAQQSKKGLS